MKATLICVVMMGASQRLQNVAASLHVQIHTFAAPELCGCITPRHAMKLVSRLQAQAKCHGICIPGDGELLAPGDGELLDPGDGELLDPGDGDAAEIT